MARFILHKMGQRWRYEHWLIWERERVPGIYLPQSSMFLFPNCVPQELKCRHTSDFYINKRCLDHCQAGELRIALDHAESSCLILKYQLKNHQRWMELQLYIYSYPSHCHRDGHSVYWRFEIARGREWDIQGPILEQRTSYGSEKTETFMLYLPLHFTELAVRCRWGENLVDNKSLDRDTLFL